ncbi:dicarboxylate/amino acid:cation symporter [Lentibacillus sp. Marseille-P4043]|uniref:dicarboxylate/amino acid:cation symporter n=1 Tax=Lentibacillus sp. Marseille-P4043 TaxID=2040293 RepID=UPI000D0AE3E1|nr:dicarboxylate/amino acid:cation symporter [Lentibacillus sp. Marseille-P4043]
MKGLFNGYIKASLILKITIALILGIIAGFLLGEQATVLEPLGELLLRLLRFLIVPLVLFTLIDGMNQTEITNLGRMGGKVFVYYILSSALALIVGLVVANVLDPGGEGLSLGGGKEIEPPENSGFVSAFLNIIPENIVTAFSELNLLGIIFTAMVFGIAIAKLRDSEQSHAIGEHLYQTVRGLNDITFKVMEWVLQYVPIGIFAIVAGTVGVQGVDTLISLGNMVGVLYIGLIAMILIYVVLLFVFKIELRNFFKHAREAMLTAFTTQSSSGTLPVTLKAANNMGLSKGLYSFSLPLGATINMDGNAIRIAVSVVFAANIIGDPLSLSQMVEVVVVGTLASIGTAGVPGAGLVIIATVFTQIGLPIETVALLASVDAIIGMGCTAVNVTGDLTGTAIVDKSEGKRKRVVEHKQYVDNQVM